MPYLPPKYDLQGNETGYYPGQNPIKTMSSANGELMSFEDYYKQATGYKTSPYSLIGKIDDFFSGKATSAKQAYENYLADYEYKRNQAATSAQNALTFAREDSQVQRLMEDYKKAGLNPYMLLSGGNLSSGVVSSQASAPAYKRSSSKSGKSSNEGLKAVTSAIRAIALIAMLAG